MSRAWRGLAWALILAVLVMALTPYLWIFLTSFKSRLDALASVPVWIFHPTFEHYPAVFLDKGYLPLVGNSVLVAVSSTTLSLWSACPPPICSRARTFPARRTCFSSS